MSLEGDGSVHPPPGLFGGEDGTPGRVRSTVMARAARRSRRSSRTARLGPAIASLSSRPPAEATGVLQNATPPPSGRTSRTGFSRQSGRASSTASRTSRAHRRRRRRHEHGRRPRRRPRRAGRGEDANDTGRHEGHRICDRCARRVLATSPCLRVQAVMIGTTHFTNAVVEARRLAPTGVDPARAAGDRGAAADGRRGRASLRDALGEHRPPVPRRPRVRRPPDLTGRHATS